MRPATSQLRAVQAFGALSTRIIEATLPRHFSIAAGLFQEYAGELAIDLCFQGFAAELTRLPALYGPPNGCLLLLIRDDAAVGCGALRSLAEGICEMKRLYVRGSLRGGHLGRAVAEQLISRGREMGFKSMRLDTLADMQAALRLYRSLGFREIPAYYANPIPNAVYLELDLSA